MIFKQISFSIFKSNLFHPPNYQGKKTESEGTIGESPVILVNSDFAPNAAFIPETLSAYKK